MAINNLKSGIDAMVQESAAEPAPKPVSHAQMYEDAVRQRYGNPVNTANVDDASLIWHNSDGDWFNRNMEWLKNQYKKRVAKPDFDPVKFGKIIENMVNTRMSYPNDFSKWHNKSTVHPTDRRYLARQIYDTVLGMYDYDMRNPQ